MSDRDPLDTVDLDVAFADLTADVGFRTHAPGADRAIRSARRRRLASAGAALAITAMIAGVVVGGLGLPSNQSSSPVAIPDPLPRAQTFDATAFNEAADGWTQGWTKGASPVSTDLPCAAYDGDLPHPLETATTEFHAGPRIGATLLLERFDSVENMRNSLPGVYPGVSAPEICGGDYRDLPDEIWSGGESVGFEMKDGRTSIYSLVVLHETEIAVLRVAGAGELPEATRERLVFALLADLRT